jgi:hypothetical protein
MRPLALLLVLVACGDNQVPDEIACDPGAERCTIEHAISTIDVPSGLEDEDACQSWTLDNPTELWVNGVTQHNDGAYHHANWFFVPDDEFALPDGAWRCSEQEFSELVAALLGGYLFALSTQSLDESQTLPQGSAIRIPPYSRIIGSSHLLNAADATIQTTMRLALHTIPPAAVQAKMAPARIQYHDLHLDPQAASSFTVECLLDDAHQQRVGGALQYELHYALAHYHNLGTYTQLEIAGGPRDGEVIMRHDGYGENFGQAIEPPLELGGATGARGVRFTCGFTNPRDVPVGWGIGDQEMCVVALQARTNLAFDADVADGSSQELGMVDGEMQHAGPCSLTAFPWDFTKPGGPAR